MGASEAVNRAPVHCSEPPWIAKDQTSLSDQQGGDDLDHPAKPVIIKIEEDDDDDDNNELVEERETNNFTVSSMAGGGGNGWSASSSSSAVPPRPMEGLHEAGPPPFLKKTFEMVEDRGSDKVVSWSVSGRSFIVWDQHQLSRDLLPKYFKHSNFSSFIRQLNTYGFRKIDPDRWDFAHEFFQRGKKPLLKNIRRRARLSHPRRAASTVTVPDGEREAVDVEAEAEILKRDQDKLRIAILELRQQQDISQSEISSMEERIRRAENRHQHMFLFLARAVKNPSFVRQLIHRKRISLETRRLEMAGGHIKKRPRQQHMAVDAAEAAEFLIKVMKPDLDDDNGKEIGDFRVPGREGVIGCEAGQDRDWEPTVGLAGSLADVPDAYQIVTENLLGDNNGMMENDEITEALKDSDLYLEFEGLIRKSQDWDGCGNEFLEPAAIGLMP